VNLYDLIAQHLIDEQDQKAERRLASGTPTRSAETTGSVGEADGGPAHEVGDAQ